MKIPKYLKAYYKATAGEHSPEIWIKIYAIRKIKVSNFKGASTLSVKVLKQSYVQALVKATGLDDLVWINVYKDRLKIGG